VINSGLLATKNLIIAGDLNFTVSANEVWGSKARLDPLVECFKETFKALGQVDIAPSLYAPTWCNGRGGSKGIAKRLDRVYMSEELVSSVGRYRSWVAYLYISDHAPVVLHFYDGQHQIMDPFKLNPIWLEEKGFRDIVQLV
jgi:endonuclease/exonuclease/phosphatase family metal-dependent hydrolase